MLTLATDRVLDGVCTSSAGARRRKTSSRLFLGPDMEVRRQEAPAEWVDVGRFLHHWTKQRRVKRADHVIELSPRHIFIF